jgi:signal transduction histidine kinase
VIKNNDIIEISFKDSAGGIDSNIINKIFEPYFTTKHQSIGTGIGLYMTNQIISKHLKGMISVKNVNYTYENKKLFGCEFKISLPID